MHEREMPAIGEFRQRRSASVQSKLGRAGINVRDAVAGIRSILGGAQFRCASFDKGWIRDRRQQVEPIAPAAQVQDDEQPLRIRVGCEQQLAKTRHRCETRTQ